MRAWLDEWSKAKRSSSSIEQKEAPLAFQPVYIGRCYVDEWDHEFLLRLPLRRSIDLGEERDRERTT